jgi:hypothetical protein
MGEEDVKAAADSWMAELHMNALREYLSRGRIAEIASGAIVSKRGIPATSMAASMAGAKSSVRL